MTDLVIARLHHALVDAMRRTRPAELDQSVTVAEIYQDLLPYRTARSEIGFEMNADYEHALLRLLAGEGDFARIEPREVRDKLRLELESPNPDVGLYRSYAACDVWVNVGETALANEASETSDWESEFVGPTTTSPRSVARPPAEIQPEAADEELADLYTDDDPPEAEDVAAPHARPAFQMASESASQSQSRKEAEPDDDSCIVCGGDLPAGRMVNFCPFCGADQSQQPCPTCGEMLEPLWRFCVSCGSRVRTAGDDLN
jgi:hypothetical protein